MCSQKITPLKNILFSLIGLFAFTVGCGQIITFDFNGLSGSEVTATSNYNDPNLSVSTISRGAGLTASNNANRFNATSWATSSIANAVSGNDYMEFPMSPNTGHQFSVSSVVIQFQRYGTGPRGIALRSSLDGYTTNLDTEKSIVDNTNTQTFTFMFAQSNSPSAVTYRLFGWAESTGGSGGPGDEVGNDIIVNGIVTATSTNTEVQFNSATYSQTEDGGTIDLCVDITNESATTATTADIALTSSNSPHLTTYTTQTVTFPASSTTQQCVTVSMTDDATCDGNVNYDFELQNVSGGDSATAGAQNTTQLMVTDDEMTSGILFYQSFEGSGTWTYTSNKGDPINGYDLGGGDETASIEEDVINSITIYPNPSENIFYISWNGEVNANIKVFDLAGKVIRNKNSISNCQLNLTGSAKGVYIVKIEADGYQAIKKIVLK